MRSTIELGEWRLACDRRATRALEASPDRPLRGCDCPYCRNWTRVCSGALPDVVTAAFPLLALDPSLPDALRPSDWPLRTLKCRVTFHFVGKLVGGPLPYRVTEQGMLDRPGYPLSPTVLCSMVPRHPDDALWPLWAPKRLRRLVQIAFRLTVPWLEAPIAPNVGLHKPLQ